MRTGRPLIRGRRGASLALSAVSLAALMGVGALAIDLGMLYKARADALHAAEAGALAGASAFLDCPTNPAACEDEAEDRAVEYATRNGVLGDPVLQEDVDVATQGQKVTVRVGREDIGTWFARVLRVDAVTVSARAAAAVEEGDEATCVSPLMIPDLWDERRSDRNDNDLEDGDEEWTYEERGNNRDRYQAWNPPGTGQTGYGSNHRNGERDPSGYQPTRDFGRQITIRPQTPERRGPNNFNLWRFTGSGGPSLESRLEECDGRPVGVGDTVRVVTSNPPSIDDEIRDLINQDRRARWSNGGVQNSAFSDWRSSSRVIKVAVYDPSGIGANRVEFNNIGLFFLEAVDSEGNIQGRFLYYVNGSSGDDRADGGSLIKHVRLVE